MAGARAGRGRLSSIDLLPSEAADDVEWAFSKLNAHDALQKDILVEFNARLAAKGIDPISSSAFNRQSLRMAAARRQLDEARYVFAGIADRFDPEKVSEQDLIIGQFLKLLVFNLLQKPGATPEDAMQLARAYTSAIQGQRASAERRRLAEDFVAKADKVVAAVAEKRGLTGEARDAILDALRSGLKA